MRNVRICGYDRPRMRKLLTNFCIYGYFIVANVNISFSEMRNFFRIYADEKFIYFQHLRTFFRQHISDAYTTGQIPNYANLRGHSS